MSDLSLSHVQLLFLTDRLRITRGLFLGDDSNLDFDALEDAKGQMMRVFHETASQEEHS